MNKNDLEWLDTMWKMAEIENQDFIEQKLREEFSEEQLKQEQIRIDQSITANISPAYNAYQNRSKASIDVENIAGQKKSEVDLKIEERRKELEDIYFKRSEEYIYAENGISREDAVMQMDFLNNKTDMLDFEIDSNISKDESFQEDNKSNYDESVGIDTTNSETFSNINGLDDAKSNEPNSYE